MIMRRHPEISIIITNYNYGKFISRCLRSCLDQKNINHEIIIVDDAASDNSREIIDGFKSRYPDRINTIFNKKNLVPNAAETRGGY